MAPPLSARSTIRFPRKASRLGGMNSAILSIGTELTRGELVNGNAAWLSERLTEHGCEVVEHCVIPDDPVLIADALRSLAAKVELVVSTGGLGPTSDDITAECVARVLGVGLAQHPEALAHIRSLWASRGREMPPSNVRQAELPAGAEVCLNQVGSAPAFRVTLADCSFTFLPGVPGEMRFFFDAFVTPFVEARTTRTRWQAHYRLFGHPESYVGDLLADVEERFPHVTLGYRAHFPELEVKVLGRGDDEATARTRCEEASAVVHERLKDVIFGGRGDTFAASIGKVLADHGKTLALAESCTGGLVGDLLTQVPGSSAYFLLSAVCYSNHAKETVLGVSPDLIATHGAVSGPVAQAMAEGARKQVGADIAVSITGIAGPDGGSEEKPVGTVWIGVACEGMSSRAHHHVLPWDRNRNRTMASYLALQQAAETAKKTASL